MSNEVKVIDRQIIEVWAEPDRAMYIEVEAGKYSVDLLSEYVNSEMYAVFEIESVDGKTYILPTRNVHFIVLHPVNVAMPAF